jgi:hypothetical protein
MYQFRVKKQWRLQIRLSASNIWNVVHWLNEVMWSFQCFIQGRCINIQVWSKYSKKQFALLFRFQVPIQKSPSIAFNHAPYNEEDGGGVYVFVRINYSNFFISSCIRSFNFVIKLVFVDVSLFSFWLIIFSPSISFELFHDCMQLTDHEVIFTLVLM